MGIPSLFLPAEGVLGNKVLASIEVMLKPHYIPVQVQVSHHLQV